MCLLTIQNKRVQQVSQVPVDLDSVQDLFSMTCFKCPRAFVRRKSAKVTPYIYHLKTLASKVWNLSQCLDRSFLGPLVQSSVGSITQAIVAYAAYRHQGRSSPQWLYL